MFLNDINFSSKHYSSLKNKLKENYGINMTFFEHQPKPLLEMLEKRSYAIKEQLVLRSMVLENQGSYIPLLNEAIRVFLKEIYPQKKVKFQEALDYKIDPSIGAAISGDGNERPDLYWRDDQYKKEQEITNKLKNPNSTPEDFINMDPRQDAADSVPANPDIYVSVLNPNQIKGLDGDVLQISQPETDEDDNLIDLIDMSQQVFLAPVGDKKDGDMKKISKLAAISESVILQEAELQRAEIVLAMKDIVSRLQKQIEDISSMATDDVLPLVDGMKENFGVPTANSFAQKAEGLLQTASDGVQALRDLFDGYSRSLEKHIGDGEIPTDMSMGDDVSSVAAPVDTGPDHSGEEELGGRDTSYEKKPGAAGSPADALMGESINVGGKIVKLDESTKAAIAFAKSYARNPVPMFLLTESQKKQLKIASKVLKG